MSASVTQGGHNQWAGKIYVILCLCKHTVHFAKHESVDGMSALLYELRKLAQNDHRFSTAPLHQFNLDCRVASMPKIASCF